MSGASTTLRNVLVLLGVTLTTLGVLYFAFELRERMSDPGRLTSLGLLTVVYVALGRHFETAMAPSGSRILRPATALYGLGVVATFAAVIVFLFAGFETISRITKVGVTTALGLGLIVWAARRLGK